ncbi:hypothetical protein PMZ80_001614 [Knufia obscura]|uniref:Uncharacterized protein n=1 Tax=Knufia obscura TaxID=1635080 RepID=A0ABR0S4N3_9EURO|nr:hypothetical protein PMZ80_001614 [Knufia obscura]
MPFRTPAILTLLTLSLICTFTLIVIISAALSSNAHSSAGNSNLIDSNTPWPSAPAGSSWEEGVEHTLHYLAGRTWLERDGDVVVEKQEGWEEQEKQRPIRRHCRSRESKQRVWKWLRRWAMVPVLV